ncbi:MAG: hypothetical protein QNJ62_05050 [Methyloceanibacter sp.]|nr:hypothetical protein [Methyloceanibacter sp.]
MKARSSKQKGDRFERELAAKLSKASGCDAKRNPGSGNLGDHVEILKGDVRFPHPTLGKIKIECKHHKRPMATVRRWLDDNGCDWLVTKADYERDPVVHMRLSELIRILGYVEGEAS